MTPIDKKLKQDVKKGNIPKPIEDLPSEWSKEDREIEGGNKEINEIDLPCVLSVQTGINEPRYVGMRGIRQVASREIPVMGASALGVEPDRPKVRRLDFFVPPIGAGAEMLHGSREEIVGRLLDMIATKGGLN